MAAPHTSAIAPGTELASRTAIASVPLSLGIGMLAAVFLPGVLCTGAWATGTGVAGWMFPAALAVAMLLTWGLSGSWRPAAVLLAYTAVAMVVSGLLYDYTYDSIAYHKPTIRLLMQGWNPLDFSHYPDSNPWTLHYAKLMEVSSSSIFAFTGYSEAGKAVNWLLIGSLAAIGYDTLRSLGLTPRRTAAVLFVLLCNPVLTTQAPSFYIDFCLYVYLALTCLLAVNIHRRHLPAISCATLLLVTVMGIGTKFNIFFFQGVALAAVLGWLLYRRDYRGSRMLLVAGLGALALSVPLFYHPYVTNWLGWGNPLYPLLGEANIDIMGYNTPDIYLGHNRLTNFLISLFGTSFPHFPFTSYDSRIAGFTLVGGPLLLVALVMLARGWRRYPAVAYYAATVVLLSCFCFEQTWWARYIPQLWLVPTLALLCELRCGRPRRWLVGTCLALAACALMLSGVPQLYVFITRSL